MYINSWEHKTSPLFFIHARPVPYSIAFFASPPRAPMQLKLLGISGSPGGKNSSDFGAMVHFQHWIKMFVTAFTQNPCLQRPFFGSPPPLFSRLSGTKVSLNGEKSCVVLHHVGQVSVTRKLPRCLKQVRLPMKNQPGPCTNYDFGRMSSRAKISCFIYGQVALLQVDSSSNQAGRQVASTVISIFRIGAQNENFAKRTVEPKYVVWSWARWRCCQ